ncbi:Toll-like receptor 13 [Camelus dromedarius]|uniref:Toll-like receptor 13 n=1 Tax=Camelus dromedarius TaxID=9838 RepID=A0A5N4C3R4_CAMDR|nr:Toll-like receptor 13 [Camelus dromedarius]
MTLLNLVETKIQSVNNSFEGLSNLETLLLSHNQITPIHKNAFVPFVKLKYLNLSQNFITDFSNILEAIQHLLHLEYLDLTNNSIMSLDHSPRSLISLTQLSLQGNKLMELNFSALSLPNLTTLDVSHSFGVIQNVDLETMPQLRSLNLSGTLVKLEMLSANHLQNLREIDLSNQKFDAKWHRTEKEFISDAFVSFTATDEQWVYEELVPALEERGQPTFKLCLHHRDFEPGMDIFENIQNAINTSQKTLCMVSNHYLHSEWCQLEVQLASIKMLYEHEDVLILIFLEEIPNYKLSSYRRLRKLVNRQTFITWPENVHERPLFWARIRNALGNKSVEKDNAQLTVAD